jgi:acetolactate synthase-1/2/3 large subunit
VVAITNQIGSDIRGTYTHQIIDHIEIFKPITKRAVHVQGETAGMQLMMTLAALERKAPGPVLIDIPTEMNDAEIPAVDPAWGRPRGPGPVPDVAAAAARLAAAKRPVVVVGCGELSNTAANGARRLQVAANAVGLTTYRGAGMLDEDHPLWAGTFGLSPVVDEVQQALLAEADLMVAVGLDMVELRPNWLPGWPDDLPIISIDAHGQPDLLGTITDRLHGPVMETLDALREAAFGVVDVVESGESAWDDAALAAHRHAWRRPFLDGPDGPAAAIHAVQKGSPEGTRICLDVGAHRITAAHVLRARFPNQILQSNGFSSMGVGLPAAIACKLVDPDRPAVALTGDAGLWMTLGELGIAQERGLDLVVVYLADAVLSLIQLKQERKGLEDTGVTFQNPDVEKLTSAFGGVGVSVRGKAAVEQAVRQAHARGGLTVIEAAIDPAAYRRQM